MIESAVVGWSGAGMMALAAEGSGGSFMDSLPDPMKLQLPVVAFVIVLLVLMFVLLKYALFRPLTQVMDDRDEAIRAGGAAKTQAASQIEARQADYATKLRELRAQALEHRRALTAAVAVERQNLLDATRQEAFSQRTKAAVELEAGRRQAETELKAQVDALAESMVQHLLKQA